MKKISRVFLIVLLGEAGLLIASVMSLQNLIDSLNNNFVTVSNIISGEVKTGKQNSHFTPDAITVFLDSKSKNDFEQRVGKIKRLFARSSFDEAILECDKALEQHPDEYWFLNAKTQAFIKMNRLNDALKVSSQNIKCHPSSSEAYSVRGYVLSCQGQNQSAYQDFQRAYDLDPLFYGNIANLGEVEVQRGDYPKAIFLLTKALDARSSGHLFFLRAIAYENSGEKSKAQKDRDMAKSLGYSPTTTIKRSANLPSDNSHPGYNQSDNLPEQVSARQYYDLGVKYQMLGATESARKSLEKAAQMDPDGSVGRLARTYLLARIPVNVVPPEAERLNDLACRQNSHDQKVDAKKNWELAIERYPNYEWPYCNLGTLYLERGDLVRAEQLVRQAIKINPNYVSAWLELESIRLIRHDIAGARSCISRIHQIDPDDTRAEQMSAH